MVWGFITINGPGKLVFIDGNMNKEKYLDTLKNYLLPYINEKNATPLVFQQDGAPCHTARVVMEFFNVNKVEVLDWAAQSPDLNPIEHIWGIIKQKLGNKIFESLEDLKNEILRIWESEITPELCEKLIRSMGKRIDAVIKARGGHTKY